jgi:hypothetical protein
MILLLDQKEGEYARITTKDTHLEKGGKTQQKEGQCDKGQEGREAE